MTGALRVLFEGTAFVQHRRSGISRYFAELIAAYDADPALGIAPVTPYKWMTNVHAPGTPRRFRSLPLPRRYRHRVLDSLNRRHARREPAGLADVAHFPLYEPGLLPVARRMPSVTTVYDFTFEVLPDLFGDLDAELSTKRAYLEACDVLCCISDATARDLRRFHPDLDKPVVVTPLGVAEEFFVPSARPARGLPERYLLVVGNRAQHKNVDLVLRSFRELANQDPTLRLVMSGQGMPDEAARLRELGVAERTTVLRLRDADLPAAYRHAQAFVMPSRYEGFGLPLLEAMAAGCPTLISNTPALVEVAGGAADVVDPDDVEGAVAALERILSDRGHADALRSAGLKRAHQFSWHRTAELTVSAYHQAARLSR